MKKQTCLYIIKKSLISNKDNYLLKLNRSLNQLEVYQKVSNNELRNYYSIREDFDSLNYSVYELMKIFPCIYGRENSPTPSGIFTIEKKSKNEYISGYYPGYGQVKFFGYLVIFEDYFIHSDIYTSDVSYDAFGSIDPISKKDQSTSGCIRVKQTDLDWLLNNIGIGCTIVM